MFRALASLAILTLASACSSTNTDDASVDAAPLVDTTDARDDLVTDSATAPDCGLMPPSTVWNCYQTTGAGCACGGQNCSDAPTSPVCTAAGWTCLANTAAQCGCFGPQADSGPCADAASDH